jgi:hypothetical protein
MARKRMVDEAGNLLPSRKMEVFLGLHEIKLTEDDWIVPSTDSKGHSSTIRASIPPSLHRVVQEFVQSQQTPFRTDSDFLRFAVWITVRLLQNRLDALPPSVLMAADAIVRVVRDHEQSMLIHESLQNAARMCEQLMADNDVQALHTRIAYIDTVLRNLSPTSRWRRKFAAQWKAASQKYRDWIQSEIRAGHLEQGGLELHEILGERDNEEAAAC